MGNRVAVGLVTTHRTEMALRTVLGIAENLEFSGELGWYVGVDGNYYDTHEFVTGTIRKQGYTLIGSHAEDLTPGTYNAGPSWNITMKSCLEWADIVLWMEDDWVLDAKLNIDPYVALLKEKADVGMVRLGHMAVGNELLSVGYNGIHYLEYLRTKQYAYSGNPSLRHRRFVDAYGDFANDRDPGLIEIAMDDAFRAKNGPNIWWPIDIGGWGVFRHIGQAKSFE